MEVSCSLDKREGERTSPALLDGILMRGHCNDELWGLATHPTRPLYCSVGDDRSLRFWDIGERAMVQAVSLGAMARTCCYSPNGLLLAVGFGGVGRGKETKGGALQIFSVTDPSRLPVVKLAEHCDAKQWISDIKFSEVNIHIYIRIHTCM
jgi:hypothetical protein